MWHEKLTCMARWYPGYKSAGMEPSCPLYHSKGIHMIVWKTEVSDILSHVRCFLIVWRYIMRIGCSNYEWKVGLSKDSYTLNSTTPSANQCAFPDFTEERLISWLWVRLAWKFASRIDALHTSLLAVYLNSHL